MPHDDTRFTSFMKEKKKRKQGVIVDSTCCCLTDVLQGRDVKDSTTVQSPAPPHTGLMQDGDVHNLCVGIPEVTAF